MTTYIRTTNQFEMVAVCNKHGEPLRRITQQDWQQDFIWLSDFSDYEIEKFSLRNDKWLSLPVHR